MAQSKALVKTGGKVAGKPKKLDEWVDYICASWRDSVRSIIETGRRINEAMDKLPRGAKEKLYDKLPWSETTSKYLRTIAGDVRLEKGHNCDLLPAHWRTLYDITKLDDKTFKKAIDMGKIHPDMRASDVEELLTKSKPKIDKNADDAEVVDDDTDNEDDGDEGDDGEETKEAPRKRSEPEPVKPTRNKPAPVPKTTIEIAFENFENGLDSLAEFGEKLEEAIEDSERPIDIDDDLIGKIKNLGAWLTRFAKDHS